tara:strand:- start:299 stop:574 length:276 start_codon:yes stop_codon:yes gene_type:complete
MVVDTPYGEFEVKDITRKERRKFYKKVKQVFTSQDLSKLHELGDEFAVLAFGDDKKADEALKDLTAVQEDEVLTSIIGSYMGLDLGNLSGD